MGIVQGRRSKLINRCRFYESEFGFHNLIRFLTIAVLGHLALFQLVDASTQSTSSSIVTGASARMSLPLGNGIGKHALPKGRCRGQDVIALVPEKDREMFVLYHLTKALNSSSASRNIISPQINIDSKIPETKIQAFKNIWTYDTFSADLLKWTMQTFELSQFDVNNNLLLRRYRRVLCTAKGWCFSPTDIGNMCCPF